MHGLLAPLLAQLVTLALSDRIEGRYILTRQDKYFEAINTTLPGGTLTLDWRRASLTFGYNPSLTLVPIVQTPREFLVYHRGIVRAEYRWRRTTLSLTTTGGYGERDFQREALTPIPAAPIPAAAAQGQPQNTQAPGGDQNHPPATGTPATGTPVTGTTGGTTNGAPTPGNANTLRPALAAGPVLYNEFRTSAAVDHAISRALSLRFVAGYSVSGGATHEAQRAYPLARGPDGTATLRYAVDTRNVFITILNSQLTYSETGNNAYYATLAQDYQHTLTRRTSVVVGAGVSFGRSEPVYGLPLYSIYPVGRAGILHRDRVFRGTLVLGLDVNTSPAIDLTTATVDPRIATALNAGWSRDRFSITATGSSSISVVRGTLHTFDYVFASLIARYEIGAGFAVDGGARATSQTFGGASVIAPSLVLFVGLSWGIAKPLNPPRNGP